MKKKKILFIIPYLLGGGALKTVSNLSKVFLDKYDVTVVGIYGSDKKFAFDGKLIELNMSHQKNLIKKFRDFMYIRRQIKQLKIENNYDYSISFLVIADFINVLTKTKNKEKTLISIRNLESIEYKDKIYRKMQVKYASKHADYIVAISKEVEEDMILNFNVPQKKIRTIYNPCILNNPSDSIDNSVFKKGKTVISLGGLKYQKGYWHLIRAFSNVVKQIPDARLLIFGQGPYEEYLKELISDYSLEENIRLMGYVIGPYNYVKKSDLFVFSSLFEGLGNALMEALKCGIVVLSTDYSSGAREILAPDTDFHVKTTNKIDYAKYGILVPVCDGKKYTATDKLTEQELLMSEAIIKVLTDKEIKKKYTIMSKERAFDFDIDYIASQWYSLFNDLEKNNGKDF